MQNFSNREEYRRILEAGGEKGGMPITWKEEKWPLLHEGGVLQISV